MKYIFSRDIDIKKISNLFDHHPMSVQDETMQ